MLKLLNSLKLKNLKLIDYVPFEKLPLEISNADICLGGHFSGIEKANRVISGKTFQFIAMKKPTIVGDNPANKELFNHRKNIYMCKMADSQSLAKGIMELKNNFKLRNRIAKNGFKLFNEKLSRKILSKRLTLILHSVKNEKNRY